MRFAAARQTPASEPAARSAAIMKSHVLSVSKNLAKMVRAGRLNIWVDLVTRRTKKKQACRAWYTASKKLAKEEPASTAGEQEPGTVLAANVDGIIIRCGKGTAAKITEVQREGRRRMPVDAFLIGERVSRGEVLG